MKIRLFLFLTLITSLLPAREPLEPTGHVLTIQGTRFLLDEKPLPLTGISFFNALYNPEFNRDSTTRRHWLRKFQLYGVNMIRVFAQWDNRTGFVDTGPDRSLYSHDGTLQPMHLATLQDILADTDALGMVVELVLFANESRAEGTLLGPGHQDQAVAAVTA